MEKRALRGADVKRIVVSNISLIVFVILFVTSIILSPVFLSMANITNILRQQFPFMLIALGAMLVIMTGGIDLAAGQILGFGSTFLVILVNGLNLNTWPRLLLGCLIVIVVCGGFGFISGFFTAYFKMAAFIVTLAMMRIVEGITFISCAGQPLRLNPAWESTRVLNSFANHRWLGIPVAVYFAFAVMFVFMFIIKYTSYGRLLIASGSNPMAVRLSGINEKAYKLSAFVISGALAGMGGIFITARTSMSTPATGGGGFELDAIAAVVIGGASIAGGKASVANTILGVFALALIGNIMNLMAISAFTQRVVLGVIILAAVFMTTMVSKKQD